MQRSALTPVVNESEHNQVIRYYADLGPSPPELNESFPYSLQRKKGLN